MRNLLLELGCFTAMIIKCSVSEAFDGNTSVVVRRKRNLMFPEGSVFSVVACLTLASLHPYTDLVEAVAWQIDYDIFAENKKEEESRQLKAGPFLGRRRRASIYRRLEVATSSLGVDGRSCVLRALCESSQRLPRGRTLTHELLRVLFTLPLEELERTEPDEHHQYVAAHHTGIRGLDCSSLFSSCPVSLIDMALGLRARTDDNIQNYRRK